MMQGWWHIACLLILLYLLGINKGDLGFYSSQAKSLLNCMMEDVFFQPSFYFILPTAVFGTLLWIDKVDEEDSNHSLVWS